MRSAFQAVSLQLRRRRYSGGRAATTATNTDIDGISQKNEFQMNFSTFIGDYTPSTI